MASRAWDANVEAGHRERRRLQRVQLVAAAAIACAGQTGRVRGVMRDVSAEGVFLWTDAGLAVGSTVEITVQLPPKNVLVLPLTFWCVGKVVRTDYAGTDGLYGVAIRCEDVTIAPVPPGS